MHKRVLTVEINAVSKHTSITLKNDLGQRLQVSAAVDDLQGLSDTLVEALVSVRGLMTEMEAK